MRTFEERVSRVARWGGADLRKRLQELQVLHLDHPRAQGFERDVLKAPDDELQQAALDWISADEQE